LILKKQEHHDSTEDDFQLADDLNADMPQEKQIYMNELMEKPAVSHRQMT
jgi:hypothetical protein